MTHKITLEQEHNSHHDDEQGVFEDCFQAVVHCESRDEARRIANLASNEVEVREALELLEGLQDMLDEDRIADIDDQVGMIHSSLSEAVLKKVEA